MPGQSPRSDDALSIADGVVRYISTDGCMLFTRTEHSGIVFVDGVPCDSELALQIMLAKGRNLLTRAVAGRA